jgi:signal transduction histidine kinase
MAFSRRQDLQPQDLDLDEVVATLLKLIERTLGASIRIVLEPGAGACTVRADRGQIEQVLLNLCLNARDAMPAGGILTIATAAVELDERFCRDHPWARPGRFARLRVADTGVGMDAGILARIWEPFFTTKDPERGTGLGLPTVYGIVRQHAGLVRVRSEEGRGTVFEIYLPVA